MNSSDIVNTIKAEKPFLRTQFGVVEIGIFGSYARNSAEKDSDIDIKVNIEKPSFSLLMGLYSYLESKLNHKIDLIRKGPHVSERFLKTISKDVIYV